MSDLVRGVGSVMIGFLGGFLVDNAVPLFLAYKKINIGHGGQAAVTLSVAVGIPVGLNYFGVLDRLEKSGFGLDRSLAAAGLVQGMVNTQQDLTEWSAGFLQNFIKYEIIDGDSSTHS